jgi:DNA-binding GntR family transcriptional regulator
MAITDVQDGPPVSKSSYVAKRLREDIRDGVVVPGQPLRQADLARRYGVSQTPVREAMRRLEVEGVISYSPHKGATVNELSDARVADLYRLRARIEELATEIAAERMTDEGLQRIVELHEQLAAGIGRDEPSTLAVLNRELHFTIYQIGSSLVADHAKSLWGFLTPDSTVWTEGGVAATLVSQHATIVEALEAKNAAEAGRLMAEHVLWVGDHRRGVMAAR